MTATATAVSRTGEQGALFGLSGGAGHFAGRNLKPSLRERLGCC